MTSSDPTVSATTVAFITELCLSQFSIGFTQLSFDHKCNTVAYFLNTFWTTVTLVFLNQLCASPLLAEHYMFDRIDMVKLASLLVSGLYQFRYSKPPRASSPVFFSCSVISLKLARNQEEAINVVFSVLFILTLTCLIITQGWLNYGGIFDH
ncbi:hypothetical protein B0H17DRAFT_1145572 [Mycena rosella]|uniref:Uncharacterized protein n=1 Tax=Mycena rosella TaxID=1033263 RepID=A0AAD7CQT6_MYCRO|nr:hypothetical protein B0H17DRAFT_1145572 [Mycena rosella]